MLGLEARVAVNAMTAVLVFCKCSSSVHLFQINLEMQALDLNMSAAIRLIKKIIVEKSKTKICVAFRPRYLKNFKPDDVSCTQCRIEANEM